MDFIQMSQIFGLISLPRSYPDPGWLGVVDGWELSRAAAGLVLRLLL